MCNVPKYRTKNVDCIKRWQELDQTECTQAQHRQRLERDAARAQNMERVRWPVHTARLKTELRGSVARSWLRVTQAGRRDSGIYYCNVTNLAAASVTIHVVPGGFWCLAVLVMIFRKNFRFVCE
ncbi:hypothetical protein E2C01_061969 [Portunus trituberculatus]|uniref:Ig-like domain-containing protein n=1 Tax=Portunus trituberculatus TaxID=210409 RepID=A0A5B7HDU5_PORTR|nr:hypothetical protein [Portunus trituberculatus]